MKTRRSETDKVIAIIYLLELEIIRGPKKSKDNFVHIGRCLPAHLKYVLTELDQEIERSESGARNLISLHRRRARLINKWDMENFKTADEVLELAKEYFSKSGKIVSCSIKNVFAIEPKTAAAFFKNVGGSESPKRLKRPKKLDQLIRSLDGMRQKDPLPAFACDVLDGIYGKKLQAACEELLSNLPASENDSDYCTHCELEAAQIEFTADAGWYRPPGELLCESCANLTSCDVCGGRFFKDELQFDFDAKWVCETCYDEPERAEERDEDEEDDSDYGAHVCTVCGNFSDNKLKQDFDGEVVCNDCYYDDERTLNRETDNPYEY
ncbi:MAG: hypothetical protein WD672_01130 [Woeseia sp.]